MENNFRMSELGFWVPVEPASSPPVEDFGEAGSGSAAPGANATRLANPPAGRAGVSVYRMSELGFWVPAHESRDSHDADHRESQAAQLEKFAAWDPSKHPRGGNPKNTGQFSKVPGASLGADGIAYGSDGGNASATAPKPPTGG